MSMTRIDTSKIKGKELDICFFGDQHIGSKDCDMDAIKKQIKWIKEQKNVLVIMMGDTINCGLRNSVGAGSFDDIMNPEEQIELAIELFTPIKDKIIGIHNGNHANRISNETTLVPEKIIARGIGVTYLGDTTFHHMRFGNQTYILFTAHGSTGAATIGGALNSCMKYGAFAHADVYAMGHTHNLASYTQEFLEVDKTNKQVITKKRQYILTGGYLKWEGSYAEMKNYIPLKIGCAKATFSGMKYDIHVRT